MVIEMAAQGFAVENEKQIAVYYNNQVVGKFAADIVVNEKVILELKATESIHEAHEAQLTNYLRSTNLEIGLLFNFGKKAEFKRKIFLNTNKSFGIEKQDILENLFLTDPHEYA